MEVDARAFVEPPVERPNAPCGCHGKKRKAASPPEESESESEESSDDELYEEEDPQDLASELENLKAEAMLPPARRGVLPLRFATRSAPSTDGGTSTWSAPAPSALPSQPINPSSATLGSISSPAMSAPCSATSAQSPHTLSLVAHTSSNQPSKSEAKLSSTSTLPPTARSSTSSVSGQTVRPRPSPLSVT